MGNALEGQTVAEAYAFEHTRQITTRELVDRYHTQHRRNDRVFNEQLRGLLEETISPYATDGLVSSDRIEEIDETVMKLIKTL